MEGTTGSPAGGQVGCATEKICCDLFVEDFRKTLCRESREHCSTDSLSEASSEYESDWEAEVDQIALFCNQYNTWSIIIQWITLTQPTEQFKKVQTTTLVSFAAEMYPFLEGERKGRSVLCGASAREGALHLPGGQVEDLPCA